MLQERLEEEFMNRLDYRTSTGIDPNILCVNPHTWEELIFEITKERIHFLSDPRADIRYNYLGYYVTVLRSLDIAEGVFIIR